MERKGVGILRGDTKKGLWGKETIMFLPVEFVDSFLLAFFKIYTFLYCVYILNIMITTYYNPIKKKKQLKNMTRDFSGGLVAGIQCYCHCGLGSVPGLETDIPYQDASCCGQTKQIKKRPDSHNRRYLNSQ